METKNRQDIDHDIIKFYPSYIDTNQTTSTGRRISKNLSSPDVNLQEIYSIITQALKLKCTPENKHFPSDWMKRGRLLVNLKENGVVVNSLIVNKNQLIKATAEVLKNIRNQADLNKKAEEKKEEEGEYEDYNKKKRRKK